MIGVAVNLDRARASLATAWALAQEKTKVRTCPFSDASVVAPLLAGVANYGSAGGSFTVRGAPAFSPTLGASFDGVDDSLHLDNLSSADFSLIFRGAILVDNNPFNTALVNAMTASVGNTTWRGWGVERYGGFFTILVHGVARVNSTVVGDSQQRTFSLVRASGTTTLYINGTSVASNASAQTLGDRLLIGASFRTDFQSWTRGNAKNLVLVPRAITAAERARGELWCET